MGFLTLTRTFLALPLGFHVICAKQMSVVSIEKEERHEQKHERDREQTDTGCQNQVRREQTIKEV